MYKNTKYQENRKIWVKVTEKKIRIYRIDRKKAVLELSLRELKILSVPLGGQFMN